MLKKLFSKKISFFGRQLPIPYGMTLIELTIVMAILAIVAAILFAVVNPVEQKRKANDALSRNTAAEFLQAALRYSTDNNGTYPWNSNSCISYATPTPSTTPTPTPTGFFANIAPGVLHYWGMNAASSLGETDQAGTSNMNLIGSCSSVSGAGVNTSTARSDPSATSANYLYAPSASIPGSGPWSMAFWVKTSTAGTVFSTTQGSFHWVTTCNGCNYQGDTNEPGMAFVAGGSGAFYISRYSGDVTQAGCGCGTSGWNPNPPSYSLSTTGPSLMDNNWHYVVITWTGDTSTNGINIYIDCNSSSCTPNATGTAPFLSGGNQQNLAWFYGWGFTNSLTGSIDEIGVWSRILTTTEISNMYGFYQGVVQGPTATPTPTPPGYAAITTPAPLSALSSCISNIATAGDVKDTFNNTPQSTLNNVYVNQPNPVLTPADSGSITVCYLPRSRSAQQDPTAKYVQGGSYAPSGGVYGYDINGIPQSSGSCISAGGANYCYVCLY